MTNRELGFMATQFERFGAITEGEIIEAYISEELEVTIDMLSDYNEYLGEQGFETYFEMSELDEILSGCSPLKIIQKHTLVASIIQMTIASLTDTKILTASQNSRL